FGHSLWGAPIFHAAHEGRLSDFAITSFARTSSSGIVSGGDLVWIEPRKSMPAPGPGNSDLVALSAAGILALLRQGEADIGAIPGNIVPENTFIRIATVVDSAAGCAFVCENDKLKKWQAKGLLLQKAGGRQWQKQKGGADATALGTRELNAILRE